MTKRNSEGIVNHQKQRSYDTYTKVYKALYSMILRMRKSISIQLQNKQK